MELGISSYTYGWAIGVAGTEPACAMDEQQLLDRALRHRVKLVQVCDNLPLHRLPQERVARFAERAALEGIRIEVGSRGLTVEHAIEVLELARKVGARLIRFVIDSPDLHPSREQAVATLREIAPLLEGDTCADHSHRSDRRGSNRRKEVVQLGIENHDRFSALALRSIVEEVGSVCVGICLDTVNSLGAGEGLETVVAELASWTINLHIKDFQISRAPHLMGFTVEGRPAGEGMLDVRWLLEKLMPFNRCQTAVLELWTPPERTFADTLAKEELWARTSLEYLRPFFDSLSLKPALAQSSL